MGENVQFFITENRNREPNNRGISNPDRNFKNRNRKFNSGQNLLRNIVSESYGEECNIPKRPGWSEFIGI